MSWFGKQQEKKVMKRRYIKTSRIGYCPKGVYLDEEGRYHRMYPYSTNHDNNKKLYHTIANRVARRRLGNENRVSRGAHKKIFDLWWKVY